MCNLYKEYSFISFYYNFVLDIFAVLLCLMSTCTAVGAWHWITDPITPTVPFTQSLYNHPFFTIATIILGR